MIIAYHQSTVSGLLEYISVEFCCGLGKDKTATLENGTLLGRLCMFAIDVSRINDGVVT